MLTSICDDIYDLFQSGIKGQNPELYDKVYELVHYRIQNPITPKMAEEVIELERKIMRTKGAHKKFIEEHIFEFLSNYAMYYCSPEKSYKECLLLDDDLIAKTTNTKDKEKYAIALKLSDFANEIVEFKMARDNFSNKRKALSLKMLSTLYMFYDVPSVHDLCLIFLKSKKKDLIYAALEFQEDYTRNKDIALSSDIIESLDKIILQTKDRSIAVGALNLQVTTGRISEFKALSRIVDWKEKKWLLVVRPYNHIQPYFIIGSRNNFSLIIATIKQQPNCVFFLLAYHYLSVAFLYQMVEHWQNQFSAGCASLSETPFPC